MAVDLSKLTPEQLAHIPAGIAPPGVTSNLINPSGVGYNVLTAATLLMAMMFVFVALRFYTAICIKRKFGLDDWSTVAAVIGSCYYFTVVCLAVTRLRFGTHMYDLSVLHMKSRETAIISFMSNGPSYLIWPCVKSSFFLMYLQLFRPLVWLRYSVYFGMAVVWGFYLSISVTQFYFTAPPRGQTWSESFAGPRYLRSFSLCVPVSSFSLISDLYILLLPLVAISSLRLSSAKKLGVTAMFSTGLIACMASSASVYFQQKIYKNQDDYTYYVSFVLLTFTIEMCVGISTSCMPSLARLHKDKGPKFTSVASTLGGTFRNLRGKSANISSGSRLSTIDGYPKKSPYSYMAEEDISSHEMTGLPAEPASMRNGTNEQPFPDDRIHLSIKISQTTASSRPSGSDETSWEGKSV